MAEHEIYYLTDQLMKLFDVDQTKVNKCKMAQDFIESTHLHPKPSETKVAVDVALESLGRRVIGDRQNLYNQYIDLKNKNVKEADDLVQFVSKVDDETRKFLKVHLLVKEKMAEKAEKKAAAAMAAATAAAASSNPATTFHQVLNPQMNSLKNSSAYPNSTNNFDQKCPQQQHHQTQSYVAPTNGSEKPFPTTRSFKTLNATPMSSRYTTDHTNTTTPQNQRILESSNLTPDQANLSSSNTTPASRKSKGSKDRNWKHDMLHQKMKDFLLDSSFLSLDFKKMNWNLGPPIPPLGSLSTKDQESVLIEDLLYVLIGTEGRYIRMQPSSSNPHKHTIGVERGGDELVYTSATRIIRICPLYSTIVHFAEEVNFGLVNQALAGTVRELIKDYLVLISSVQTTARRNEMTLSTMNLQLLPFYYIMKALKEIVDGVSRSSFYGGHTLSILHNRIVNFGADLKVQDFCLTLMETASEPYFEILHGWLYMGVIDDPFGEFFISDNEKKNDELYIYDINHKNGNMTSNNDCNYDDNNHQQNNLGGGLNFVNSSEDGDRSWEKRFACDYSKVPEFLRSLESMILGAGKYICVVRRYGQSNFKPLDYEPLFYTPESRIYSERVQRAYKFASKKLLNLLMDEKDLIGRLHSIKRYFLMESGDFFVQFTDMAEEELGKATDDIDHIRLESLLELALRTSGCELDPYKDDLRLQFSSESLFVQMSHINNITAEISAKNGQNVNPVSASVASIGSRSKKRETPHYMMADFCLSSANQLFGWEALVLAYDIKWPLSIVISEKCQTCYQLIFRHLFCCKYVELQLQGTWKAMQQIRMYNVHRRLELAFALRQKMLNFVQNLLYHMMIELIEPNFNSFINKIKNDDIESVDEVIKLHSDFVTGILQDSMLTSTEMLQHVTKLLVLCMEYSVITNSMCQQLKKNKQDLLKQQQQPGTNTTLDLEQALRHFQETIMEMNKKFDTELKSMIQRNPTASTVKWLKLTSRLE